MPADALVEGPAARNFEGRERVCCTKTQLFSFMQALSDVIQMRLGSELVALTVIVDVCKGVL